MWRYSKLAFNNNQNTAYYFFSDTEGDLLKFQKNVKNVKKM